MHCLEKMGNDWRPLRAFRKYKAVSLRRKHSGNCKADCVVNNRAAGQKYEKYSHKRGQRTVEVESSDRCIVEGAQQTPRLAATGREV
jgi:hypothetical protein